MSKMRSRDISQERFEKQVAIAASAASDLRPGERAMIYDKQKGPLSSADVRVVRDADGIKYYVGNTSWVREWFGNPDFAIEIKR